MEKINIAIAGGPCTGKSTLAAGLFAALKDKGKDVDLITEEMRHLKKEFGSFRSVFERFYAWRQQEREELRSNANNGFITDTPLFSYYVTALQFATEPRDQLAVRELLRMSLEIKDRYHLIVLARDYNEIPYQIDTSRTGEEKNREIRHTSTKTFLNHYYPNKTVQVHGPLKSRISQVLKALEKLENS